METITVVFHSDSGDSFTITRDVDGSAGALLFAARDMTAGARITSIDITDGAGGDFATAQWRSETCGGCVCFASCGPPIPEPGTMPMLGVGVLGALGVIRRKINL